MTVTTQEIKYERGRPEKPIDWELVDKLIIAQNNGAEIAGHFDLHPDTFYTRVKEKYGVIFTVYAGTLYSKGKSNLRTRQYQKAMEGCVPLLIKLGEIYLDDQKPKNKDENLSIDLATLLTLIKEGKIAQKEESSLIQEKPLETNANE